MKTIMIRLRTLLATGFIALLPAMLTVYALYLIFLFADGIVGRFVYPYLPVRIPGLGLLMTLGLILLAGLLATNLIGRALMRWAEALALKTPIVRPIYATVKQILDTLIRKHEGGFKRVVLIEYPRRGLWSLAFVTANSPQEVCDRSGMKLVSVFLPTTPNPTSGYLLMVPADDIRYLDMTVEDGVKIVISAGVVIPESRDDSADGGDAG